ncbi:MAG: type 1 glutamine amidotransferase domain-containing protein [Anaerolineae bacterium]
MELENTHIAVLAENLFEDLELWYPLIRMREAGAEVVVVGMPDVESYTGKHGLTVTPDLTADQAAAEDFDAVIIPGGYAPDYMRRHDSMLELVRRVHEQGGVIAFICHAGWVPISAGIVKGKNVTSVSAIKDDLINAGANWADQAVIKDGNLISSRRPADLPIFCRTIIATLAT